MRWLPTSRVWKWFWRRRRVDKSPTYKKNTAQKKSSLKTTLHGPLHSISRDKLFIRPRRWKSSLAVHDKNQQSHWQKQTSRYKETEWARGVLADPSRVVEMRRHKLNFGTLDEEGWQRGEDWACSCVMAVFGWGGCTLIALCWSRPSPLPGGWPGFSPAAPAPSGWQT